ncbi:dihydrodipicolinate synthase family protein [Loigolactobacillus zhaoyuanensis]|uniref:dihydrodipicolinate synthase family protein n=1 Tax=Loigolactobacillus zhaoyuanensis TaxID=2486017 RepID=UPI000F736D8C|nr:dihydrodipicolinate synthase family protein [Loigolactobacillus zhaoyuanensis]
MDTTRIKGIIVPLITPVDAEENIDDAKLRKIVDHVIEGGVQGILAFGSNSEFYMFDDDELAHGFKIIKEQAGDRVPVYFGMGPIRTRRGLKLAKKAVELGADAVSILQPMFLAPTDEELFQHYKTIADAIPDTPVLVYNNPRVGYGLSAQLVSDLAHQVPNIVGMKDSSGNLTLLSEIIRLTEDIEFRTFTGKDTLIYLGLCLGTYGSVCSTANALAPLIVSIYDKFQQGDYKGSRAAQFKLNPARLVQNEASFPVATKDMANILGLDMGKPILPSTPSTGKVYADIKRELDKLN